VLGRRFLFLFWLGLFIASAGPGCSEKPKFQENKAADHLRKIGQAFDMAQYAGGAPNNADEIKPFLKKLSPKDDPEILLRSPNDGEPYEIVWGVNLERQSDLALIFAHEKNGVNGKRYVINVGRIVSQMEDSEFQNATYAKGRR
jgi:hypothetical protein